MADVLVPLPDRDFDTTEVAIPWHVLTKAGHRVTFATEHGDIPTCDPLILNGVIFGRLGCKPRTKAIYAELEKDASFTAPLSWDAIDVGRFDALLLPGGHAKGMRQYLGSALLQSKVAAFWATGKPVGAICHGTLVLARAREPETGRPLLEGRKSTCLPKYMERTAWLSTAWKLGDYYRTYPAYVEDELREALGPEGTFVRGPLQLFSHGTEDDDGPGFVVEDGDYVSARWPGDAWLFARKLIERIDARATARAAHSGRHAAQSGH